MFLNKHVVALWIVVLAVCLVSMTFSGGASGVALLIGGLGIAISGYMVGVFIHRPANEPARVYSFRRVGGSETGGR